MDPSVSAGLVIIQNNELLLVHPRNASWWNRYSVPKGIIEDGETPLQAAIRETKEETGIEVSSTSCRFLSVVETKQKTIILFSATPTQVIKPEDFVLNDEIDWIGFLGKKNAWPRLLPHLRFLLNYLK